MRGAVVDVVVRWRDDVIEEYGSMQRYTAATAHQINAGLPVLANRRTSFKPASTALPPLDTSRPAFQAIQEASPNKYMHVVGGRK